MSSGWQPGSKQKKGDVTFAAKIPKEKRPTAFADE
jgi:hypothetical protein